MKLNGCDGCMCTIGCVIKHTQLRCKRVELCHWLLVTCKRWICSHKSFATSAPTTSHTCQLFPHGVLPLVVACEILAPPVAVWSSVTQLRCKRVELCHWLLVTCKRWICSHKLCHLRPTTSHTCQLFPHGVLPLVVACEILAPPVAVWSSVRSSDVKEWSLCHWLLVTCNTDESVLTSFATSAPPPATLASFFPMGFCHWWLHVKSCSTSGCVIKRTQLRCKKSASFVTDLCTLKVHYWHIVWETVLTSTTLTYNSPPSADPSLPHIHMKSNTLVHIGIMMNFAALCFGRRGLRPENKAVWNHLVATTMLSHHATPNQCGSSLSEHLKLCFYHWPVRSMHKRRLHREH